MLRYMSRCVCVLLILSLALSGYCRCEFLPILSMQQRAVWLQTCFARWPTDGAGTNLPTCTYTASTFALTLPGCCPQLCCYVCTATSSSVKIVPDVPEIELEMNQDYKFTCYGSEPVQWTFPFAKPWNNVTKFTQSKSRSSNGTYIANLKISNMTHRHVGAYSCNNASIYLFVNDPVNLAVEPIVDLYFMELSEIVIPCRPTSRKVTVTIKDYSGYKIQMGVLDSNRILYAFDPYRGFFTNNTLVKNYCQFYRCRFERYGSENESINFCVAIEERVAFLYRPIVKDLKNNHTVTGTNLSLSCEIETVNSVIMKWIHPSGEILNGTHVSDEDNHWYQTNLVVENATLQDAGTYTCVVTDYQEHMVNKSIEVRVFESDVHFVKLEAQNPYVNAYPNETVSFTVYVDYHPESITFTWLNNYNQECVGSKYRVENHSNSTTLKIFNVDINDLGKYTITATNINDTDEQHLFLNVTDKPTVDIITDNFHLINSEFVAVCEVGSNPPPTITWSWQPCAKCENKKINGSDYRQVNLQYSSTVKIKAVQDGYLTCSASNSLGTDTSTRPYYVSDVGKGFDIMNLNDGVYFSESTAIVTVGDDIVMSCGASPNDTELTWFVNDVQVSNTSSLYDLNSVVTQYSNHLNLTIMKVTERDTGVCRCNSFNGVKQIFKEITYRVMNKSTVEVELLQDKKDLVVPPGGQALLECKISGRPKPKAIWKMNNEYIDATSETVIKNEPYQILSLNATKDGTYECVAKLGGTAKSASINVKVAETASFNLLILLVCLFLLVMMLISIALAIKKHRSKEKLEREMKLAGLENFIKGAVENINCNLAIDEQAELLPYDQKWEFPSKHLKLGQQLGSGAFGVVLKAVAKNIVEDEDVTIVAVKMVKKNAEAALIKALASELKIMVHLGKHLNVVNLLGACTTNVSKRELMVIVEFCRYGNLHNYLFKHRSGFVNQVDPKTGSIDYTIGQDILERSYSVSSGVPSPTIKYTELSFANNHLNSENSQGSRSYSVNYTSRTEMTSLSNNSNGNDEPLLSNNSVQPAWRSNYRGDYKDNVKPICTKDLLIWAFQVSRGMEFLASRRVLHGDLAARNILLADNNIVKICDFGLAKSMYKTDCYKKREDSPLPIKWMAIESISDRVFSTQSDVWSFGVVLWEFFSLSKTPYPGMQPNQTLYEKLVDGYRMEKPDCAPKEIYKMMQDCWMAKPLSRPSFTNLTQRLGEFVEDSVRKHYIDLNDPYLLMNTQKIENGTNDYLAMLSPPDYEVLSSPDYINNSPDSDSGYLQMNSADIFSPRVIEGQVFDFSTTATNRVQNETGVEGEVEALMPSSPDSYSNPSYHLPPKVEIAKSADNYVNMPQNKQDLKQMPEDKVNHNYVNNQTRDWETIKL